MITDESISSIERTVAHLQSVDPAYAEHPAVIAAPGWWMKLFAVIHPQNMETSEDVLDEVAGCKIIAKDGITEPVLVAAGGTTYPVLPSWARGANHRVVL